MTRLLLLPLSLLLTAASPSSEAERLMDSGKEKEAFELIERAAAQNDADAVDYLAWFYDEGRVVGQDLVRAADLYRRAANAGNRHAQWRLGVMLDLGLGVRENPDEAFVWLKKAAAQGSPRAYVSLGLMHAMGRGTSVNYGESLGHYLEAARLGERHGFYGVGILHARGEGVSQDLTEALVWMMVSATLGDVEAKALIEKEAFIEADGAKAAERANQIFKQFGLTGMKAEFQNFDAQAPRPQPPK